MNEAGTWQGGRPQPRRLCVRWGPSTPPPKGGGAPSQIFGPFLLWLNGSMHEDATWYGCWPQPRGLCVRWRTSHPSRQGGGAPKFSAHVYCGQTAEWIKMSLGMEVDLGLRDILFDVDPATPPRKMGTPTPTQFLAHVYCGQMAGWMKTLLGTEVDLGAGHIVLGITDLFYYRLDSRVTFLDLAKLSKFHLLEEGPTVSPPRFDRLFCATYSFRCRSP